MCCARTTRGKQRQSHAGYPRCWDQPAVGSAQQSSTPWRLRQPPRAVPCPRRRPTQLWGHTVRPPGPGPLQVLGEPLWRSGKCDGAWWEGAHYGVCCVRQICGALAVERCVWRTTSTLSGQLVSSCAGLPSARNAGENSTTREKLIGPRLLRHENSPCAAISRLPARAAKQAVQSSRGETPCCRCPTAVELWWCTCSTACRLVFEPWRSYVDASRGPSATTTKMVCHGPCARAYAGALRCRVLTHCCAPAVVVLLAVCGAVPAACSGECARGTRT